MARHPYHDVAIAGVYNTEQARVLEGYDSRSITFAAGLGAVADAGLTLREIDGVMGQGAHDFSYQARIGPVWRSMGGFGLPGLVEAAGAIAAGSATTVLITAGSAGVYTERASTAPWTRPANEFVVPFGMCVGTPSASPPNSSRRNASVSAHASALRLATTTFAPAHT